MGQFLKRPALIGAVTAVLLSVPAAAVAQTGHAGSAQPGRRAALLHAWEHIHKVRNLAVPAWAAGKSAAKATRAGRLVSGGYVGTLNGVAAVSAGTAFAVGTECASGCGTASEVDDTLILQWDGTSQTWTRVTSPNPSATFSELTAVTASSATNAWAVGDYCASGCGTNSEVDDSLVLRWKGGTWTKVPSAHPGGFSLLLSVSTDHHGHAWAAGVTCSSTCTKVRTLTERWNGSGWVRVASPSPNANFNLLTGVSTLSGSQAWAVGYQASKSLIIRWNGTKWATVTSPNPGKNFTELAGSAAQSAKNAWAVGMVCSTCSTSTGAPRTLAVHWNGTKWATVTTPNLSSGPDVLNAVAARTATDTWAVGYGCQSGCAASAEIDNVLILHWNGTKWAKKAGNVTSSGFTGLADVSADSASDAWAVGTACSSGCGTASEVDGTLILHWNGHAWSVV